MLKSIESVYRAGKIKFLDMPKNVDKARGIVTFIPEKRVDLRLRDIDETHALHLRTRISIKNINIRIELYRLMMHPGHILRRLRKEGGLSLREASRHLGMSHQNLSYIERDEIGISPTFIKQAVDLYRPLKEDISKLRGFVKSGNRSRSWHEEDFNVRQSYYSLIHKPLPKDSEIKLEHLLHVIHTEAKMLTLSHGLQENEWMSAADINGRLQDLDLESVPTRQGLRKQCVEFVRYGFAVEHRHRQAQRKSGKVRWKLSEESSMAVWACDMGIRYAGKEGKSLYAYLGHSPYCRFHTIEGALKQPSISIQLEGKDYNTRKRIVTHLRSLEESDLVSISDGKVMIGEELRGFYRQVLKPLQKLVKGDEMPPIEKPTAFEYQRATRKFYDVWKKIRG